MPYDNIDLDLIGSGIGLLPNPNQDITWTNVDFSSVRSCGIHLRAISQEVRKILLLDNSLKNNKFKITAASPGANGFICPITVHLQKITIPYNFFLYLQNQHKYFLWWAYMKAW